MQILIPWLGTDIGLGGIIKRLTTAVGIRPCGACAQRAESFDRFLMFTVAPLASGNCATFSGRCTGFGSRQCVQGPVNMTPDAAMTIQCCNGWFQYPWITACESGPVQKGCGFCFW
jgi:hypothetical protein